MKGHNGIDFKCFTGTSVYATFGGKVTFSGLDGDGGRSIRIQSTEIEVENIKLKLEAVYYHLKDELVQLWDNVIEGDEIAISDNTGKYTTGAHLHYGIKPLYKDDKGNYVKEVDNGYRGAIDPMPFFKTQDYQIYPVDTRYGQSRSLIRENLFKIKNYVWVTRKLGRKPMEREVRAFVYGYWDYKVVVEPIFFPIWTVYTKIEHQKKMKEFNY